MDTFGNAVLIGVQTGMQKTFVDTMKSILIPAYEKSSGEMFKQIQEVFVQGASGCKWTFSFVIKKCD